MASDAESAEGAEAEEEVEGGSEVAGVSSARGRGRTKVAGDVWSDVVRLGCGSYAGSPEADVIEGPDDMDETGEISELDAAGVGLSPPEPPELCEGSRWRTGTGCGTPVVVVGSEVVIWREGMAAFWRCQRMSRGGPSPVLGRFDDC